MANSVKVFAAVKKATPALREVLRAGGLLEDARAVLWEIERRLRNPWSGDVNEFIAAVREGNLPIPTDDWGETFREGTPEERALVLTAWDAVSENDRTAIFFGELAGMLCPRAGIPTAREKGVGPY